MKFSTRTLYGLKAVLVLASRYGEGSIAVSHIARKEGISLPYLEQILNHLKRKGLVKSVRGPQGGYVLAKKPAEVNLKELFDALSGSPAIAEKTDHAADEVAVANALFWTKFQRALDDSLSGLSLKNLLDEARQIKKGKVPSDGHTFHI